MRLHWTELLPVDRFSVRTVDQLGEREHKTLHLLYQPLIGTVAVSLYTLLWSKLERDRFLSEESTHHELMAMMNLPLDDIFEARRLLEGMGLMRTFRRKEEKSTVFVYELQPPMTPAQFFQNDVLSVFLYNKLGKDRYLHLRSRFMIEAIDRDAYAEVTASFNDVFSSLHYSEITPKEFDFLANDENFAGQPALDIPFSEDSFDFELLKVDLPAFIDADRLLNDSIRSLIQRLAFVYQLGPLEMSRMVQQSLSSDDKINEEELRQRVQEWYRFEHSNEPPGIGLRTQPDKHRTMKGKTPTNEKEEMILFHEQTSPLKLLESISEGAKVPEADIKLVETLLFDYQLQPGVVNVLIDYVLKTNNMKLNQNLVQKIAGHWARKKIYTVEKAMDLAKKEHQERKRRQQSGTKGRAHTNYSPSAHSYVRKDKLPKWLENDRDTNHTSNKEEKSIDLSQEKKQFEEMLRLRNSSRQK